MPRILIVACTILFLGASVAPSMATTAASSDDTSSAELSGPFPADIRETISQTETDVQQNGTLEQAARQGVEEGIAYLESSGVSISEEHRQAAYEGAETAVDNLEQRGINETKISSVVVTQSALGATIGALYRTEQQSVIAVPNPSSTEIAPT